MSSPQQPRVSVVMAVFNRADVVERALDSVREQTYAHLELVVIDGGSTDGTAELLRERSSEIEYLHIGPDDGIYDAWNHGVRSSTGEWVLFLGSDDRYASPQAIERLVATTTATRGATLGVGRVALMDERERIGATIGTAWSARRMRLCMVVAHPACLHHRSLLDTHGPFDTSVGVAADYDLLLRASGDVRAADHPEVVVHFSDGGVTSTQIGRVLRSTHDVQRRHPRIGPARAAVQYAGFRVALPVRGALRSARARRRS